MGSHEGREWEKKKHTKEGKGEEEEKNKKWGRRGTKEREEKKTNSQIHNCKRIINKYSDNLVIKGCVNLGF